MLSRYTITDPTAGKAVGTFATTNNQQLYNKLVAQGAASVNAAYAAARTVETADIADLNKAKTGVSAPDVLAVCTHLLTGSQRILV